LVIGREEVHGEGELKVGVMEEGVGLEPVDEVGRGGEGVRGAEGVRAPAAAETNSRDMEVLAGESRRDWCD
jgi:hypothetical protein